MPTYAYRCRSCTHEFEEWQKITDDPLVTCPSCRQDMLVRVIGAGAGLIFKGSGFYLTDYKKTGSGKTSEESPPASEKKPPDKPKPAKPEGETSSKTEQSPGKPKSKD